MEPNDLEAARGVALRFLGYSARSRSEMQKRLERDAFAPEVIAAVLAELEARNWVNDAQFARDWVEDRADRKKYGKGRLAAELRRKGVDKDEVTAAIETVEEEDEVARARGAAASRWKLSPEETDREAIQAEKRRVASFLQRRGFGWGIITQVLAEHAANQEEL
jgi:regulatory protein